jgi:hypothetical protein
VISDEVRRFVLTSIPSVPYLEAALLFRAQPAQERSAVEVARALYLDERSVAPLLEALCEAGIVRRAPAGDVRYRYAPRDEALAQALDRLAQAYADDLVGVTTLIHDATQKKALRFADAFRLRKDP